MEQKKKKRKRRSGGRKSAWVLHTFETADGPFLEPFYLTHLGKVVFQGTHNAVTTNLWDVGVGIASLGYFREWVGYSYLLLFCFGVRWNILTFRRIALTPLKRATFVKCAFESSQHNCRARGFDYSGSEIMIHSHSSWCSQSQPSFGKDNWIRSMQLDLAKH